MFLRGYGYQDHSKENGSRVGKTNTRHQSGNLGEIQGDGTRRLNGHLDSRKAIPETNPRIFNKLLMGEGKFFDYHMNENGLSGYGLFPILQDDRPSRIDYNAVPVADRITYDNARVFPIANEIRPANIAIKYIIKVR